tara:strand:- start:12529 stop:12951 length:423 start_codon:yes stop_codon:yes gene_type:complete
MVEEKKRWSIFEKVKELGYYDAEALSHAQKSYGDSWKRRGGVGAFMMLARKWDRIENQTKKYNYDIFETILADPSNEGIIDDIWDLRRYLFLVEAEIQGQLSGFPSNAPTTPQDKKSKSLGSNPLGTLSKGNREPYTGSS